MTATTCAQNAVANRSPIAQCAGGAAGLTDSLRCSPKALSLTQVADLLSLSRNKIYNLVRAGQIPHLRIGASIRFDGQALASWLDRQQVQDAG
jgi:excisionase family DNA binding protein